MATTPTWPTRLISELDASDQRARALVAGLAPERLNWQPSPASWSIGQCLEHLCITGEVYLPPIMAALDDPPSATVEEITPGWFARWFIKSYIAPSPQTRKASAPKKIAPSSRVELAVLDRFLRGNEATRQLIRKAENVDVNRIRFQNPFIPVIRFTVGTGFEIIARHEDRHLLQAERVRESSGFPK